MTALRVLIGCEESGAVRRAFAALGHDAWSCDLKPSADGSNRHIIGDVRDVMLYGWDLAVFHPPCTALAANSVAVIVMVLARLTSSTPAIARIDGSR